MPHDRVGSCSTLKPIGRRVDCAREEFEYQRAMRKRGTRGADRPARLLCQGAVEWPSATISLGRWGSIKSHGWILRNEDGVAALRAHNLPIFKPASNYSRSAMVLPTIFFFESEKVTDLQMRAH